MDFRLMMPPTVPVTRFRCMRGERHGVEWNAAALFPVGRGEWGLRLVDDVPLVLRPAPVRAAPSFSCDRKGLSNAERAIRADPVLAGWDLSVAQAYKASGASVDEQRSWIAERDRCGSDTGCLQDAMALRTANLLAD